MAVSAEPFITDKFFIGEHGTGSLKDNCTISCIPARGEWIGSGISQAIFSVSESDNKSYLYEYDVPHTSICQKSHWNDTPGSGSTILHQYVSDVFSSYVYSTPVFQFGVDLTQAPTELK